MPTGTSNFPKDPFHDEFEIRFLGPPNPFGAHPPDVPNLYDPPPGYSGDMIQQQSSTTELGRINEKESQDLQQIPSAASRWRKHRCSIIALLLSFILSSIVVVAGAVVGSNRGHSVDIHGHTPAITTTTRKTTGIETASQTITATVESQSTFPTNNLKHTRSRQDTRNTSIPSSTDYDTSQVVSFTTHFLTSTVTVTSATPIARPPTPGTTAATPIASGRKASEVGEPQTAGIPFVTPSGIPTHLDVATSGQRDCKHSAETGCPSRGKEQKRQPTGGQEINSD